MKPDVISLIGDTTVIPVLAFSEMTPTLRLMENMISSGLTVIELTLRSDVAMETLVAAKAQFGRDARIGMGTITHPDHLHAVEDAEADFGVSPGLTPDLLAAITASDLPFLPGTSTVAEAMTASAAGFDVLKFFPAAQAGGPGYLKAMGAVLGTTKFCPTGGVTAENARDYLSLPNVICVGSSSLTAPAAADPFDAGHFAALMDQFQP